MKDLRPRAHKTFRPPDPIRVFGLVHKLGKTHDQYPSTLALDNGYGPMLGLSLADDWHAHRRSGDASPHERRVMADE